MLRAFVLRNTYPSEDPCSGSCAPGKCPESLAAGQSSSMKTPHKLVLAVSPQVVLLTAKDLIDERTE